LPRSSHAEESMMKVVSIGIGQTSSVGKKNISKAKGILQSKETLT